MIDLKTILEKKRNRIIIRVAGGIIGFLGSAFIIFQVLFLYRVLPHGGL